MMNETSNEKIITGGCCGRPMNYASKTGCNYKDECETEYPCSKLACIKERQPDCKAKAVIPSITVDSVEGITDLANCLVHVNDINTTFYIDDKHRIMITWAGPVNIPGYDMETNPERFRDQIITDTEAGLAVIYDAKGVGFTFGIEQGLDVTEAVNNKIDEMAEDGTLAEIVGQYLNDKIVYAFDTVANMEASLDLTDGSYAKTLGFYSINDGGEALYKIKSSQPSGHYESLSSGLYAELIIGNEAHTKQFGCYGDGVHDDTVALQNTINYAVSNNIGVVYIDNGVYKISDTLTINKTIKITGEYFRGRTNDNLVYGAQILQTVANKSIFKFEGRNYRSEVLNLALVANHEEGVCAITTDEVFDEFVIDRVSCMGFDKCFDLAHAGLGTISNCLFSGNNIGVDCRVINSVEFIYNNFWNNTVALKIGQITGCKFDANWVEVDDNHSSSIGILFQAPSIVKWSDFTNNNLMMKDNAIKFDGTTNINDVMSFNMMFFNNSRMSASRPIIVDMKNGDGVVNHNVDNKFRIVMTNCVFNNASSGYAIDIDYDALGLGDGMKLINCKAYSDWAGGAADMFISGQSNTAITNAYDFGFLTNGNIQINPIVNNAIRQNNSIYSDSSHRIWLRDNDGNDNRLLIGQKGATTDRPSSLNVIGDVYFDTTLGQPIWWDGTNWVDSTGTAV